MMIDCTDAVVTMDGLKVAVKRIEYERVVSGPARHMSTQIYEGSFEIPASEWWRFCEALRRSSMTGYWWRRLMHPTKEGEPMAKRTVKEQSPLDVFSLKISTTVAVLEELEELTSTGLFGKSRAETAEQLIRERLRELAIEARAGRLTGR